MQSHHGLLRPGQQVLGWGIDYPETSEKCQPQAEGTEAAVLLRPGRALGTLGLPAMLRAAGCFSGLVLGCFSQALFLYVCVPMQVDLCAAGTTCFSHNACLLLWVC